MLFNFYFKLLSNRFSLMAGNGRRCVHRLQTFLPSLTPGLSVAFELILLFLLFINQELSFSSVIAGKAAGESSHYFPEYIF